MTDQQFLMWIHDRLAKVHGEREYMDYMHKLRAIIADMEPLKTTPNVSRMDTEPLALRSFVLRVPPLSWRVRFRDWVEGWMFDRSGK